MLIYNKRIFSKYNYIYNILLYKPSIVFFLSKSVSYIFLYWLLWNVNRHFFKYKFILFNYFDVFYNKPIQFFLQMFKLNMKSYSNHKKTCMHAADGIIKLNNMVKHYSKDNTIISVNHKIILTKKEFLNIYKYRFFNFSKFKNIFNLLLFLLPLWLLNLYETWTFTTGYKQHLMHNLILLVPFLQKKYFFFNYYL